MYVCITILEARKCKINSLHGWKSTFLCHCEEVKKACVLETGEKISFPPSSVGLVIFKVSTNSLPPLYWKSSFYQRKLKDTYKLQQPLIPIVSSRVPVACLEPFLTMSYPTSTECLFNAFLEMEERCHRQPLAIKELFLREKRVASHNCFHFSFYIPSQIQSFS